MQAQMNPHFLFNTINTGVQLAIVEEAEKTADFMENLAALFRYNIREKKFFVQLRHEYEGLKSYFNILKIRFPKLSVWNWISTRNCWMISAVPPWCCSLWWKTRCFMLSRIKKVSEQSPFLLNMSNRFYGFLSKTTHRNSGENRTGPSHSPYTRLPAQFEGDGLENVIQRCYFFYPDVEDVVEIHSEIGGGTEIVININTEVEPCIEL